MDLCYQKVDWLVIEDAGRYRNIALSASSACCATLGKLDSHSSKNRRQSGYPFRIDHDEKFNQTTHVQYSFPIKRGAWVGLNWRYDSGLVAGSTPCYNVIGANPRCSSDIAINGKPGVDLGGFTPDQQFQAGITCNGVQATPALALANAWSRNTAQH